MEPQNDREPKLIQQSEPIVQQTTSGWSAPQSADGGVTSASQTNMAQNFSNETNYSTDGISNKIKYWKKFSLIIGLVTFFRYIFLLTRLKNLARFGFRMSTFSWPLHTFILLVLLINSFVRIIVLSIKRKKHILKDYIIAIIGLLLIFSPYAIHGILSFFGISWNEDYSLSAYYLSGRWSNGSVCIQEGYRASNDLKDVDINEYYDFIDDDERKIFAAEDYVKTIGEEVLCQVGEFYKTNGRYPNEDEIESFQKQAVNEDVKSGIYDIKLEEGKKPNRKDFTILFDKNCSNKTVEDGNVVVLSPLYGASGRYCVYNDIDVIVNNLSKTREW